MLLCFRTSTFSYSWHYPVGGIHWQTSHFSCAAFYQAIGVMAYFVSRQTTTKFSNWRKADICDCVTAYLIHGKRQLHLTIKTDRRRQAYLSLCWNALMVTLLPRRSVAAEETLSALQAHKQVAGVPAKPLSFHMQGLGQFVPCSCIPFHTSSNNRLYTCLAFFFLHSSSCPRTKPTNS